MDPQVESSTGIDGEVGSLFLSGDNNSHSAEHLLSERGIESTHPLYSIDSSDSTTAHQTIRTISADLAGKPPELKLKICDELENPDICAFALTTRSTYHAVWHRVWRSITVRGAGGQGGREDRRQMKLYAALQGKKETGSWVRELRIASDGTTGEWSRTELQRLAGLFNNLVNLEHVTVDATFERGLGYGSLRTVIRESLKKENSTVLSLSFSRVHSVSTITWITEGSRRKILALSVGASEYGGWELSDPALEANPLERFEALRSLDFGSRFACPEWLGKVLPTGPQVTLLSLDWQALWLTPVGDYLRAVRHLKIYGTRSVGAMAKLHEVLSAIDSPNILDLGDRVEFNDLSLLLANTPMLRSLSLSARGSDPIPFQQLCMTRGIDIYWRSS